MVIIDTVETFENVEYKNDADEKVKGSVNRFFASPLECKRLFGDVKVIKDVNENGNTIKTMIEKIPFNDEEISRKSSLKGKTHYVFRDVNVKGTLD